MRNIIKIVACLLLLSACNHKELCFHHPHTAKVKLGVDWSQFEKEVPTGMTVMIYPQDGSPTIRQLSNTTTHIVTDLEAGLYNTIVYNQSETEYGSVAFVGMDDFNTAEVRINTYESRWYASRAEGERVVMQPEWIGTDSFTDALVTPEMVQITGNELLETISRSRTTYTEFLIASHVPQNIIYTINVKVHLKNAYNLRSARASLDGLAASYSFAEARTTEKQATQLLEQWNLTIDKNDPTKGYITTQITTLGLPYGHSQQPDDNEFVLSMLLVDGETIVDAPFKVGDQLSQRYNDEGKLVLEFDLELWYDTLLPDVKPAGSSGGGFSAVVDDWGEEHNVDIGL